MAAERLDKLRTLNATLAARLHEVSQGSLPDIPQLTALISQGGSLLEEGRSDTNAAWQAQVAEYHQTLLKLKVTIEKMQSELGARKDRLRAGDERLRAFSKWIDALKDTR